MAERDIDIVVLGASGGTGQHAATHIAKRAGETGVRWAGAGRDPAKIERVLTALGTRPPETIIADVNDAQSIVQLVSRARVVVNMVGQYTRYAWSVIQACVEHGAHYVDIAGEVPFARRVIDAFHELARDAGLKIVQFCGYLSVPADVAVRLAAERAANQWSEVLTDVDLCAWLRMPPLPRPSDGGGAAAAHTLVEVATDVDSHLLLDPAALVTEPDRAQEVRRINQTSLRLRRANGSVVGPMFPLAFNGPIVVHRTSALLAAKGGSGEPVFRYREGLAVGRRLISLPLGFT